jgi:ABC-type molybdate transport system substrate-binding protein
MFLMAKKADAGVTWRSEAIFQEQVGHAIENVAIPDSQNVKAIYAASIIRGARHKLWAKRWLIFLKSPEAQKVFRHFGFKSVTKADLKK